MKTHVPMLTDEQKKECLIGFLDFLLDSSEWPERNLAHTQGVRKALKQAMQGLKYLHAAGKYQPNNQLLRNAIEPVREAIWRFKAQVVRHRWEGPHLGTEAEPGLGNIEEDRRLFVAYLIFKRARSDGRLRAILCPHGSAIDCMIEYAQRKGFYASDAMLKRRLTLYKRKRDMQPPELVGFLYSHYVYVRKGQKGFSEDERILLLELTSKLGQSRRKRSQRSK